MLAVHKRGKTVVGALQTFGTQTAVAGKAGKKEKIGKCDPASGRQKLLTGMLF